MKNTKLTSLEKFNADFERRVNCPVANWIKSMFDLLLAGRQQLTGEQALVRTTPLGSRLADLTAIGSSIKLTHVVT